MIQTIVVGVVVGAIRAQNRLVLVDDCTVEVTRRDPLAKPTWVRTAVIAALRRIASAGLGRFRIGRRGQVSRLILAA
jgi:hypothetical protein